MHDELFQPYERLIEIQIQGQVYHVPNNNTLLRCFQFVCMDDISCGRFCWNQECKTCSITYEVESGEQRVGLSCQTMAVERMRIVKRTKELRWALRSVLKGAPSESAVQEPIRDPLNLGL